MNRLNKVAAAVLASTITAAGAIAPSLASAETTANVAVSNMYLWRGTNLSPTGGVVSGGLDYAHESGLYAGVWTSSETDGHETDVYGGFSGETGDFSYDVSYIHYFYPEDGKLENVDLSEAALSVGYGAVSAAAFVGIQDGGDDYVYYTVGADVEKFNFTYGAYTGLDSNNYSHVTVSFAATDELSFALSMAQEDDVAIEEDPLFAVTYSKSFDVK